MASDPKQLGPYKILGEVGVGGLGRVFKAVDIRNGRFVAVKILHDRYANDKKFLGIFHRELMIISSLHHKHVVDFIDSHFVPPNCYIVTEFIEGWSGNRLLKKVGRFPPLVALSIIIDILQGIDYLHLHDTVHADLSSANYLVEKTGKVVVTDFGLACNHNFENYKNYMVGTPGYHSPEHITEQSIVPQTDVYCIGLLLFELITGTKAITASSNRIIVLKSMKKINFNLIQCSDRKLQTLLRKLLKKALHPNYKRRIEGADVMMFECYKILKSYNIRYARYAIKQFLIDRNLIQSTISQGKQDIYRGAA